MKKYLFLFIWIIVPVLVISQEYDTIYMDHRLEDYLFETGSFWVYERTDSTDITDSLVQTSFFHGFNGPVIIHGEVVMGPVEFYKSYYQSMTLNYQTWDQYLGDVIVREGINWGNNGQYIFICTYEIGANAGGAEIIDTMDVMLLNGFEFYHVTRMLVMQDIFENNNPVSYYYAQGVGLIRKEIYSGDTTNLVEAWNIKNWQVDYLLDVKEEPENVTPLLAFPNPAKDYIHLSLDNENLPCNVVIYDLKGSKVYEIRALEKEVDLDLSMLNKGIYIIYPEDNNLRKSIKVIKN